MDGVEIGVLGPVVAQVGGRRAELGGPQQRAVLAALTMAAGAVVSRSGLVDRLWPEEPPASAAKLVQKYVSGLRSSLGADAVETIGGGYRLTVAPDRIDVARFESVATEPSASVDAGDRAAMLAHAEREWRGDPYAGCGDPPFVLAERERLVRLRLEMQLDRLAILVDRGELPSSIGVLDRLAVEHPANERVTALLMRGLYRSGRHVEALRAFRQLERHLRDELGVDPSPELRDLERQVLRHDDTLRPGPTRTGIASVEASDVETPDPEAPDAETAAAPTLVVDDRTPVTEEIRPIVAVVVHDPPSVAAPDDRRAHHERLVDAVVALSDPFGAAVERASGGEVVLVFGVPVREDDAERAVALAHRICDARPSARVVVVAGDALVTVEPAVAIVAADLLDRARHLLATARSGQLLTTAEVDARLGERDDGDEGPLVGRDAELETIAELWGRVVADGRLRMVETVGEPGIGKTRLVHEAVARLSPTPNRVIGWASGRTTPPRPHEARPGPPPRRRARLRVRPGRSPRSEACSSSSRRGSIRSGRGSTAAASRSASGSPSTPSSVPWSIRRPRARSGSSTSGTCHGCAWSTWSSPTGRSSWSSRMPTGPSLTCSPASTTPSRSWPTDRSSASSRAARNRSPPVSACRGSPNGPRCTSVRCDRTTSSASRRRRPRTWAPTHASSQRDAAAGARCSCCSSSAC